MSAAAPLWPKARRRAWTGPRQPTGSAVFIDVSRDEDLIVQDTNPSQRLNIGVPVGRNLFVIYSNALDRNAPRWTVELRPTGELRVRAISDSEDGNAIQVAHRFSFNVWSRRSIDARQRPAACASRASCSRA